MPRRICSAPLAVYQSPPFTNYCHPGGAPCPWLVHFVVLLARSCPSSLQFFCGLGRLTVTSFNRVCPSGCLSLCLPFLPQRPTAPRTKNPEKLLSATRNCVLRASITQHGRASSARGIFWTNNLLTLEFAAGLLSGGALLAKFKVSPSLSKFGPGMLLQDLICSEFRIGADTVSPGKLHHKVQNCIKR